MAGTSPNSNSLEGRPTLCIGQIGRYVQPFVTSGRRESALLASPPMRRTDRVKPGKVLPAVLIGLALAVAGPADATPYDYVPLGDPLEAELRILDLYDSRGLKDRIHLPHLGTRPIQAIELQGRGAPPDSPDVVRAISLVRLERALGRDRAQIFSPHPEYRSTPRLL